VDVYELSGCLEAERDYQPISSGWAMPVSA
jgi:hypothetical protein